jgi:predicted esterase
MNLKSIVRSLPARTHGRYLLQLPDGDSPRPLLVGFHGYAENAEIHLRHLSRIPGAELWLTASVQALHPFYKRTTGEVIASWMTRLDRDLAVADNVSYVAGVVAEIKREQPTDGRLVYAGFSQGAAMAYRAAAYAEHPCQGLVVLGGDVPPEVKGDLSVRLPPILLGRGRRDEWYTQQKMDADLEFFALRGASVSPIVFEGGHGWADEFLEAAARFLGQVKSRSILAAQH